MCLLHFTLFNQQRQQEPLIRSKTHVRREYLDPSGLLPLPLVLEQEHHLLVVKVVLHDAAPQELDNLVLEKNKIKQKRRQNIIFKMCLAKMQYKLSDKHFVQLGYLFFLHISSNKNVFRKQ